ncbi:MAG: potassium channel family protein [Patescibacteria group bacterium]
MTKKTRVELFNNYQTLFEVPMVFLTMLLLGVIIIEESFILNNTVLYVLGVIDVAIWLIFVLELVLLTYLAPSRIHYLKAHWYDGLIVFLPFLRILRLFQISVLVTLERTFLSLYNLLAVLFGDAQLFRVFPLVAKFISNTRSLVLKHRLNYLISVIVAVVVFLGSLGAVFEQDAPGANITNIYEGIWWGIVSITTVGYGDRFPVTLQGRIVGVILMTLGVILFSLLTANIASFMVEDREKKARKKNTEHLDKRLTKIEDQLMQIIDEIEDHHSTGVS